jgi:hypothetical protein
MGKLANYSPNIEEVDFMRTKQQYFEGLSKMKRNLYCDGALMDRLDERQMDTLNTIGTTFDEAARPENQDLLPLSRTSRGEDKPLHSYPSKQGRPA